MSSPPCRFATRHVGKTLPLLRRELIDRYFCEVLHVPSLVAMPRQRRLRLSAAFRRRCRTNFWARAVEALGIQGPRVEVDTIRRTEAGPRVAVPEATAVRGGVQHVGWELSQS